MEIGQGFSQIVDRNEEEMFHRTRRSLDGRRGERGLPVRRVDDPVDAGRLGSSQQGAEVLGVLERIEDQHERRFVPFDGARQDVFQAGELPPVRDQGDPWWPSKPASAVSVPPSTSTIGIRRLVACRTSFSSAWRRCGTTSSR